MTSPVEFSVIIVCKNSQDAQPAVDALKSINYNKSSFEVLLAKGANPSLQRNLSVEQSRGEWLLFLDNDSIVDQNLMTEYHKVIINQCSLLAIGGPTLLKSEASLVERVINYIFTCYFGVGPMRSRYMRVGTLRKSDDKELILCNLLIKKDVYQQLGGLNPLLYPNEENFFLNRLKEIGDVYYNPNAAVYRGQRKTIKDFILQMIRYGEGRTKQSRLNPQLFDAAFLIPFSIVPFYFLAWFISPLQVIGIFYLSLIIWYAMVSIFRNKNIFSFVYSLILFPCCHFFYSLGLWKGLVVKFSTIDKDVKESINIEIVKS